MRKVLKDKLSYIVTFIISVLILLTIFYFKDIFPFGKNTVIYGDMHDQITAFYYHFYDSFRGNGSLMIDYTTSGGVNFIGILAYYVLSPVSLILLLFKRENIYLAISLVVAIKIVLASLTCLYSIRYLFKEKINFLLSVALSISYAFCGYSLLLYQITSWMDLLYLFPLISIGLKKVLDLEKPYLYIITLTLGIIFSFYLSYMMLIFIFLLAIIYVVNYVDKSSRKKSITALGITTGISILLSSFIMVPSLYQIMVSSRLGFTWNSVLYSKFGPITDKAMYFVLSPFLLFSFIFLLFNYKKNTKFLKWFVPSFLVVGIPYVVEPINKILHFMSYAFFPSRYGFIAFYLLVIMTSYYFSLDNKRKVKIKYSNQISIICCSVMMICVSLIANYIYIKFQKSAFSLTFSRDKTTFFIVVVMFLLIFTTLIILNTINSKKRVYNTLMFIVAVFTASINATLCIGLTDYASTINEPYLTLNAINNNHKKDDFYRTKNSSSSMVTNHGMVTQFYTLDHFTSLTDEKTLSVLKMLGYSSHWTKTSSKNGTLFADLLMANKYYITRNLLKDDIYINRKAYYNHFMYESIFDVSFGYFANNLDVFDYENTFTLQNAIYKAISSNNDELFTIYDNFSLENIELIKDEEYIKLNIIDKEKDAYIRYNLKANGEENFYFQLFKSLENGDDNGIYGAMDVYVNNTLIRDRFPLTVNNGVLNLKLYNDEDVNIKIKLNKEIEVKTFNVASVKIDKLKQFAKENKVNSTVKYNKNKVTITVDSEKEGLFFIPITYSNTYQAKVNGKQQEIIKVYNNFLGVNLKKGTNTIEFTYTSPYLKTFTLVSLITLILTIIIFKLKIYDKLISNKVISNIIYNIYIIAYILLLLLVYVIPFIIFMYSLF